jgi:hypothetical protein
VNGPRSYFYYHSNKTAYWSLETGIRKKSAPYTVLDYHLERVFVHDTTLLRFGHEKIHMQNPSSKQLHLIDIIAISSEMTTSHMQVV